MDSIRTILAILAVCALLEALLALLAPQRYQGLLRVWLRIADSLPTLLPIVFGALGIGIWVLLLTQQPLHLSLTALAGVLLCGIGLLHAKPERLARFINQGIVRRSVLFVRVVGLIALLLAGFCLWVALTGR